MEASTRCIWPLWIDTSGAVVSTFIGEILEPDAGLDAIEVVFRRFGDAAGAPGTERGCMACSAATELAQGDIATRRLVERYVGVLEHCFHSALTNAIAGDQLDPDLDPQAWARPLTTTLVGMFMLLRAQLDGAVACSAGAATVRSLRSHAPTR